MTKDEARRILGNQPAQALRNMATALSLHPWNNTAEDWKRCEALRTLGYKAPKPPTRD